MIDSTIVRAHILKRLPVAKKGARTKLRGVPEEV
jgi:hypothetical protein